MKRIFLGSFVKEKPLYDLFEHVQVVFNRETLIKWTRTPENLHLTWHFFGETPLKKIYQIQEALYDVLDKQFIVDVHITGIDFFNRRNKPAVLYAVLSDSSGRLQHLFDQIQHQLYVHQLIQQPAERFVPHITLGRIKKVSSNFYDVLKVTNEQFQFIAVKIVIPQIIESILTPHGALYKPFKI